MPEIHDIVETTEHAALLLWWQWVLIGLAAILLLSLLMLLFKRSAKPSIARKQNPLQIALAQLSAIKTEQTTSNQLAVHLSLVVRQYLQRRFDDRALFETDEEFHARSADFEKLPTQSARHLQDYLQAISEHKYAPNPNHPAALESLIEKASSLVKQLDSTPQAPPAK